MNADSSSKKFPNEIQCPFDGHRAIKTSEHVFGIRRHITYVCKNGCLHQVTVNKNTDFELPQPKDRENGRIYVQNHKGDCRSTRIEKVGNNGSVCLDCGGLGF